MVKKFAGVILAIAVVFVGMFFSSSTAEAEGQANNTGWIRPSPAQVASYPKARMFKSVGLPKAKDLTSMLPAPRNQGTQGSCVGWAVGYAYKSYQEGLERSWSVSPTSHQFSPSYIYNQINNGQDNGSFIADAFELLMRQGVCTLTDMPYNEYDYLTQPTPGQHDKARKYKSLEWGIIAGGNINQMKAHIANGDALVVGVSVYPDLDNLSATNPVYDNARGAYRGNHAICLIGYDDAKQAFKFINSWGKGWGLSGYGYISYDLINNWGTDAYVMTDRRGETLEDDHGDTFLSARKYFLNGKNTVSIAGKIEVPTDYDMFQLVVPSNGSYKIYTSGNKVNTKGHLYASNGAELTSNDNSGSGDNFSITYFLKQGQTYYLRVSHSSLWGTGSYKLNASRLQTPKDDYGNTFSAAQSWALTMGQTSSRNGCIEVNNDIDMFKFTAPTSGTYTFSSVHSNVELKGSLYSSGKSLLTSNTKGSGNKDFKFAHKLSKGKTYYLKVNHSIQRGIGNYTLNIAVPRTDDYGDSFEKAYKWAIRSGKTNTLSGSIEVNYDFDVFKFTAPKSGKYTIYSSGNAVDLEGALFSANRERLIWRCADGGNRNFKFTYTLAKGKTYYISVTYHEPGVGISKAVAVGTGAYKINVKAP